MTADRESAIAAILDEFDCSKSHYPYNFGPPEPDCFTCETTWPCPTALLAGSLAEARGENRKLQQQVKDARADAAEWELEAVEHQAKAERFAQQRDDAAHIADHAERANDQLHAELHSSTAQLAELKSENEKLRRDMIGIDEPEGTLVRYVRVSDTLLKELLAAPSQPVVMRVERVGERELSFVCTRHDCGEDSADAISRERLRLAVLALPWAVTGAGTRIQGALERPAVLDLISTADALIAEQKLQSPTR